MKEEIIPVFEKAVDQLACHLMEIIHKECQTTHWSIENLLLNTFTSCIFKTVAKPLKNKEKEQEIFSEQIKQNLLINFKYLNEEKSNEL